MHDIILERGTGEVSTAGESGEALSVGGGDGAEVEVLAAGNASLSHDSVIDAAAGFTAALANAASATLEPQPCVRPPRCRRPCCCWLPSWCWRRSWPPDPKGHPPAPSVRRARATGVTWTLRSAVTAWCATTAEGRCAPRDRDSAAAAQETSLVDAERECTAVATAAPAALSPPSSATSQSCCACPSERPTATPNSTRRRPSARPTHSPLLFIPLRTPTPPGCSSHASPGPLHIPEMHPETTAHRRTVKASSTDRLRGDEKSGCRQSTVRVRGIERSTIAGSRRAAELIPTLLPAFLQCKKKNGSCERTSVCVSFSECTVYTSHSLKKTSHFFSPIISLSRDSKRFWKRSSSRISHRSHNSKRTIKNFFRKVFQRLENTLATSMNCCSHIHTGIVFLPFHFLWTSLEDPVSLMRVCVHLHNCFNHSLKCEYEQNLRFQRLV